MILGYSSLPLISIGKNIGIDLSLLYCLITDPDPE